MSEHFNYKKSKYFFQNSVDFKNTIDKLAEQYILIYIQVEHLLKDFCKIETSDDLSFPIDFYGLAEWLGIRIEITDLNYFRFSKFSMQLGKLKEENNESVIYLEKKASPVSARYALAHEISHYLCNHNNINCLASKLPSDREELIVDIVTSFLILPPKLTFLTAWEFTQNNLKRPVDLNEILIYLSQTAKMPYYRTVTAYEHLKIVACYLRTAQSRDTISKAINERISKNKIKEVEYISRELEKLESIASEEFFS